MSLNDPTSRIVNMFCSFRLERFELATPYVHSWYIWATDSFSAIRIKTDLPNDSTPIRSSLIYNDSTPISSSLIYPELKDFPLKKLRNIFDRPIIKTYTVRVAYLDKLFESFNKVPVMDYSKQIKCSQCEWEWLLDCCNCNSEYDCEKCNGTGAIGKPIPTSELEFDQKIYVLINGCTYVQWSYLLRISEVAKELWEDIIYFQFFSTEWDLDFYDKEPIIAKIWEAEILIMPLTIPRNTHLYDSSIQYLNI